MIGVGKGKACATACYSLGFLAHSRALAGINPTTGTQAAPAFCGGQAGALPSSRPVRLLLCVRARLGSGPFLKICGDPKLGENGQFPGEADRGNNIPRLVGPALWPFFPNNRGGGRRNFSQGIPSAAGRGRRDLKAG